MLVELYLIAWFYLQKFWSLDLHWFKDQIGGHARLVLLTHWFLQLGCHLDPLIGS